MPSRFTINIAPYVREELALASLCRQIPDAPAEFRHLENAHVIGQESTYWHVTVHIMMLYWAIRNSNLKECVGQVLRIIGAATKTAFGLVPKGNTGGANVSPFKVMPIKDEHQDIINRAKSI